MDISLPVAERTTTGTVTKEATDSSVSITADYSSRYVNYDASGTSAPFTPYIQGETTEDRSSLFTLAPQADKYLYFNIPTQYTGWDIELSNSSFELIDAEIREDMNQLQVHIRNTNSRVQSGTVTVVWALVTGWYSPTPIDIPLDAPAVDGEAYQNGYSYEIVGSVTLSVGSGSSYSISDDGATLTVNGWVTTEGYPSGNKISASCTVAVERRYVSGYSGYASVSIEDTAPYDIAVSSVSSGVTSHSTPYYSNGYIRCTLYANYSTNASVTFSYKVDTTVTEKYFNVNFNGVDVEEVNFDGVDLDPNA